MMANIFYGLLYFLSVMFDPRDSEQVFKIKWFFLIGLAVVLMQVVKEVFNRTSNTLQFWVLRVRVALGFKLENKSSYYNKCADLLRYSAEKGHTDRVKVLLAAGVDANEMSLLKPNKNALRYALSNRHLDVIKVLLAAGAHLKSATTSEVAFFINNIIKIIYNDDQELALSLLKVMPEEKINLVLARDVSLLQLKTVYEEYRLDKLKETIFNSTYTLLTAMRQAAPVLTEPGLIRDQILPGLKPEWCTQVEYKAICENVFSRTLKMMNSLEEKTSKIKQQKPDAAAVLVSQAPKPVIFRRDPKSQNAVAVNDVLINVLPLEKINTVGLNHGT